MSACRVFVHMPPSFLLPPPLMRTSWSNRSHVPAPRAPQDAGGGLNEALLPEDSHCKKVYPWMYPRVNNIFEVRVWDVVACTCPAPAPCAPHQLHPNTHARADADPCCLMRF